MFVYIGSCVPWMAIETKFSKLCIFCSLDEHLYHHYWVARHTRPNCYKWLATQQSNSMIASGNQNQISSSFALVKDLLKALIFLSNLNGFNSSPSPPDQRFAKRKGSSKVWKEKGLQVILSLFLSLCFLFLFLFVFFSVLVYFVFSHKN